MNKINFKMNREKEDARRGLYYSRLMKLQIIFFGFIFILAVFLIGCAKKDAKEGLIQFSGNNSEEQAWRKPRLLDGIFVDEDKAELTPIAVVIDNFVESRPVTDLNSASIVYEVPVEAAITRFLAIFDSGNLPEKNGPVRSARPYLAELAGEYNGLFIHAGGSSEVLQKIKNNNYQIYNIDGIGADGKYFWRDSWREAPFNLYISAKAIEDIFKNKKIAKQANFEGWQFSAGQAGGKPVETAGEIEVKYKEPIIWQYDKRSNSYLRFQSNQPHLDETGKQISAKNVILQITDINVIDEEGRREIGLNGMGKAEIFFEGRKIDGVWRKENGRTRFYDSLDQEIKFIKGNIWIEIISDN